MPAGRCEPDTLALLSAGIAEDRADPEPVMALTEDGGAHDEAFSHDCLGREFPAFDSGLYGRDRKTAKSKAIRDQGLRLLLGHGTGSRVSRHRLDVI